jgi:hypothetical protein
MWDLCRTKWHWVRFSPSTSVSLANHHSTKFTIIIITGTIGQWWPTCRMNPVGLHPHYSNHIKKIFFKVMKRDISLSILWNPKVNYSVFTWASKRRNTPTKTGKIYKTYLFFVIQYCLTVDSYGTQAPSSSLLRPRQFPLRTPESRVFSLRARARVSKSYTTIT